MRICEEWVTAEEVEDCLGEGVEGVNFSAVARLATRVLFRLSGSQFSGVCDPETVYPYTAESCSSPHADLSWTFDRPGNLSGACRGGCHLEMLAVPGPIAEVSEVRVDGEVLGAWTVAGRRRLRRTDGGTWPCRGVSVTYSRGVPVPEEARYAALLFACQVGRGLGGGPCQLPARVTGVLQREGVSFALDELERLWEGGSTGVPLVDLWIGSVNPYRRSRAATIHRADDRRRVAR